MSAVVVSQAKEMADFIVAKCHRGPGDTIEAAMHRAERSYGVPVRWLHKLRYRELRDLPASAFITLLQGYEAAAGVAERGYEQERSRHESNSALVRLADLVAGKKASGKVS